MKKRRMRLAALLMAAMMLCGLAVAEPVHEHQWSAWQKSADHPSQETRTCLECSAVETREHEWGAWIDQGLQGYRYMFLYGIGTCVVGGAVAVLLLRSIQKSKKA